MFDPLGRNSLLSEARQDFLFACALHGLIPEKSIEEIQGDMPMQSLPASGVLMKDELVRQYAKNPAKIDQCIAELESANMEGNSGATAGAIIEILHTLCANNDTMTLKSVCNTLSCKTTTLDVLMLFTPSDTLLRPLCTLIDNWQDHEDQGEYQPVYDEFGSILLFIVIVQHRFKLESGDMGIEKPDSFLVKYYQESSKSRPIEDLSEHESHLLGSWIKGLFETEGISDELMSTCKPKEFHLLVATLFDQSLKACQAKVLALDTLRGGFEYLLQPVLLPSLVAGFTWFSHCMWEINDDTKSFDIMLPALKTLLQPRSMPHDSSDVYKAIVALVTPQLSDALSHAQKQYPSRSDIPRLEASSQDAFHREGINALNELASWSTTSGGGLTAALRQTTQALTVWSAVSGATHEMTPPSYTHRQLLDTLRILGAPAILNLFIEEANNSTQSDTALDIFVIMIFTSSQQSSVGKRQLTLREALHLEYQNVDDLARTDPARASTIVRLYRRVEALAAPKTNVVSGGDEFMTGVEQSGDGMQPTNIDDVLGEAEHKLASAQNAMFGHNALMGLS
ncbi:mediator of RNA polymerase II transcription subunit 5, partial [Lecanoromycetidae sp. Uapishka_2]